MVEEGGVRVHPAPYLPDVAADIPIQRAPDSALENEVHPAGTWAVKSPGQGDMAISTPRPAFQLPVFCTVLISTTLFNAMNVDGIRYEAVWIPPTAGNDGLNCPFFTKVPLLDAQPVVPPELPPVLAAVTVSGMLVFVYADPVTGVTETPNT